MLHFYIKCSSMSMYLQDQSNHYSPQLPIHCGPQQCFSLCQISHFLFHHPFTQAHQACDLLPSISLVLNIPCESQVSKLFLFDSDLPFSLRLPCCLFTLFMEFSVSFCRTTFLLPPVFSLLLLSNLMIEDMQGTVQNQGKLYQKKFVT